MVKSDISINDLKTKIKTVLDQHDGHFRDEITGDFYHSNKNYEQSPLCYLEEEIGQFNLVESYRSEGGGDFDGWTWHFSITFKDGIVRHFQVEGGYSSWEGSELDDAYDFYEVKEVERVVKVWEQV